MKCLCDLPNDRAVPDKRRRDPLGFKQAVESIVIPRNEGERPSEIGEMRRGSFGRQVVNRHARTTFDDIAHVTQIEGRRESM